MTGRRFIGLLYLPFFPVAVMLDHVLTGFPLRSCIADAWAGWRWLYWER